MGFLGPWFLAGLAAVGLPIWLHLLRRHRSTPRPFSSLMFFERRTQSSVKHRRLEYILLFALRTALLILLALAFANPYLRTSTPAGAASGGLLVLAVDQSFSMREGDRLARAKREALARLEPGRRTQVIALSNEAHLLNQPGADLAALRGAIESIQPTDSRSSYAELVRALRAIAGASREPLDVHLFSDLQKSSLPAAFADLKLPSGAHLTLHPAADSAVPNWTVESVIAPRQVYGRASVRVLVTVAGFNTPAAKRTVSLFLNGREVEKREASLAANGRATVEFERLEPAHGANRCEVRIDSADTLPADDRRYFAVERTEPLPVLLVHSGASRDVLYFRAALEASANSAFRLEEVSAERSGGVAPAKYAFVALSDLAFLEPSFEDSLKKYVRGGGAVWVALGTASASRRTVPLLDNAAVEGRYFARDAERFQTVSYADAAHPSIRRANGWQGVRFYHVARVDAPDLKTIARLSDNTPVLQEATYGEGRILIFGSTFDGLACDFPLRPSFVPFVEQTARYLAGLSDAPADFLVDSYLQVRTAREHGVAVEVVDPEGKRPLSLKEAASVDSVPLEREGFYEVNRSNGRRELVAVNADRGESDLTVIAPETVAAWQSSEPAGTQSAGAVTGETRKNLWPYVLALALLAAVAESLVGNRYLNGKSAGRNELRKEAAA
ncbi:MAG: BatA domain-containing protein [Rhodospirillales bacterium]